ncbi:restriction endonuclease subunit S [Streptomyces albus]|uniref:restriction endonuclease subunit S n=1 Tax=Streptomyces albus TaxID=1888 RepID=UPI003F1B994E
MEADALLVSAKGPRGFGALPSGWHWASLQAVCSGVFDCPHSTPKLTKAGPFVVRTQDIVTGVLDLKSAARVSRETYFERIQRAQPTHGDLLYSREGTYFGIAAEVPAGVEVCLGQRMVLIRPDSERINSRFLRYWLNSAIMAAHVHGYRDGSVAQRLNLPTIRGLPVLVPSMAEQKSIVGVLGALDDKVEVNKRTAFTAESLCRAIFSEQSWEKRTTVEEISSLRKEQVLPAALAEARVAHYSLPAFDSGAMPEIADPRSIKSAKFVVYGPSVLLSKLNPEIPRVWNVFPDQNLPALASTEFLVLEPRNGVTAAELWAVLYQPGLFGDLAAKATGTSKSHQRVRPSEVMTASVIDPRELGHSRGQVRALADRAMQARNESRALADLRDTLLPQLMSGKLRVRDAEKIVEDAV